MSSPKTEVRLSFDVEAFRTHLEQAIADGPPNPKRDLVVDVVRKYAKVIEQLVENRWTFGEIAVMFSDGGVKYSGSSLRNAYKKITGKSCRRRGNAKHFDRVAAQPSVKRANAAITPPPQAITPTPINPQPQKKIEYI